ncbi:mCG146344, partial [Mus musculus]
SLGCVSITDGGAFIHQGLEEASEVTKRLNLNGVFKPGLFLFLFHFPDTVDRFFTMHVCHNVLPHHSLQAIVQVTMN